MFTGLVEEIGKIATITKSGDGRIIKVECDKILSDLKIDDSVAIEGVCQTVVSIKGNIFEVVAVEETLRKTNFKNLSIGKKVNLERAIRLSDRLGGHIVQGHVDSIGEIKSILQETNNYLVSIELPKEFKKWVIPVGSICLNGVSLTVAKVQDNTITVAIIPHTWQVTTLASLKVGDSINIEFDVLGKYIENMLLNGVISNNMLTNHNSNQSNNSNSILNQFYNQPEY